MSDFNWKDIPSFGEHFAGLYELMVDNAPPGSTLVEIGCYQGRSLIHLGIEAKKANKGLKVIGVDWAVDMSQGMDLLIRNNISKAGLSDTVDLIVEDSRTAHGRFAEGSLWFVFLDGRHTPHEAVAEDVTQWMPKVSENGFLAGHDYKWYTVCEAVNARVPVVLYEKEWEDCWFCPKQELNIYADIMKPTTIPKDFNAPTIREYMYSLGGK